MADSSQQTVQKLWNYCNVLRDDGVSYGDYVEQLEQLANTVGNDRKWRHRVD
jgi:type I restriction enzyme M protein